MVIRHGPRETKKTYDTSDKLRRIKRFLNGGLN